MDLLTRVKPKIGASALALVVLFCVSNSAFAQYAWELMRQPEFRSAYLRMLGPKSKEKWLAKLPGPSEAAVRKVIGGEEFLFVNSCKPHACDTDNIAIAYSKGAQRAFAKLREGSSEPTLIGAPPGQVKSELEAYYEKQFALQLVPQESPHK